MFASTSQPVSFMCRQSEYLQFLLYFEISSNKESTFAGNIKSNLTLLNPGVSIIPVSLSSGTISQCLVVCVPRLILSLTDFVFKCIAGFSAFTILDFPTPLFPHNAEVLPFKNLYKSFIPLFSIAEVKTIL